MTRTAQLLAAACLFVACADGESIQTVVRYGTSTDLEVPAGTQILLEVWPEGTRQHEEGVTRGPFDFEEDIKLVVNARGADPSRRFTVYAELLDSVGNRLSWARTRAGFLEDGLGEVRVDFAAGCRPPRDRNELPEGYEAIRACGSHDTCMADGTCASPCVEVEPFVEARRESPTPEAECADADCLAVDSVELGWDNTCALSSGEAFCWGETSFLPSDIDPLRRPSRVVDEGGVARVGSPITDITVHVHHICLLDATGVIRCGGSDRTGNLGLVPARSHTACCSLAPDAPLFSEIDSGAGWVGGLNREDGSIWYTGSHPVRGGVEGEAVPPFRPFRDTMGFVAMYAARNFVAGFEGDVFRWFDEDDPPSLVREDELMIDAAGKTLCAISNAGSLRCWGESTEKVSYAVEPQVFAGAWRFIGLSKYVADPTHHRCGIRDDGSLRCWGRNDRGQLGVDGPDVPEGEEVTVGSDTDWIFVAAGREHTCGIREGGQLFCWGNNGAGQLGAPEGESGLRAVCVPAW